MYKTVFNLTTKYNDSSVEVIAAGLDGEGRPQFDIGTRSLLDDSSGLLLGDKKIMTEDDLGIMGSVTIETENWDSNQATIPFGNLGQYDLIEFYPATQEDKTKALNANIFASASVSGGSVTFTVAVEPTESIMFNYFITKGRDDGGNSQ